MPRRPHKEDSCPPKTRSQKKKEQDPPPPQVLKDAEHLLEIGNFIAKQFAKKGIQTELNIHLYPS
jgi:hypothetical protein